MTARIVKVFVTITLGVCPLLPQTTQIPTSVDSALVLDAAGPEQRRSLGTIYLVVCPGVGAGTGFLLESGVVITNAHVVGTCNQETLLAITAQNQVIHFNKVISDTSRDLALLIPKAPLQGGVKLAVKDNPVPGTTVSTWGYPLLYNGASPLLSVGYVSGYRVDNSSGKSVKHIVVNGAFNHGNSGGPLLMAHSDEVIGIVVLTYHFYPPVVKQIIDGMAKQQSGLMVGTMRKPDGTIEQLSEARVTAMVLEEFYQKTQVMIGEAIAASELRAFMKEHSAEISTQTRVSSVQSKQQASNR